MGKKRVVKKGGEAKGGSSAAITRKKGKVPQLEKGRIYIQATYNNTMISLTDERGNLIAASSAGRLGFKGPKKATPYAATQVIESLADIIQRTGIKNVEVYVRGIGSGRESAIRAIPGQGLHISSIRDVTPVPHNGPRARKPRRV